MAEALECAPDFEIAGIVRRDAANIPSELKDYHVVSSVSDLEEVDVAILSTPTRSVEKYAGACLESGINTVDSFDIQGQILQLHHSLHETAKKRHAVSVISTG